MNEFRLSIKNPSIYILNAYFALPPLQKPYLSLSSLSPYPLSIADQKLGGWGGRKIYTPDAVLQKPRNAELPIPAR